MVGQNKQMRLGIDCDGVLADFTTSYLAALKEVSGRECELHTTKQDPHCWYWPTEYGYTKAEDTAAWTLIMDSPVFWYALNPTLEARAAILVFRELYARGHEVYFITNRPGIHPHAQTYGWLLKHGMGAPQVLVSDDKGPIAKGLKLTHFLDDKWENVQEVKEASPTTAVFLLSKRYNEAMHAEASALGIVVVTTIRAFLDALALEEAVHAIVV